MVSGLRNSQKAGDMQQTSLTLFGAHGGGSTIVEGLLSLAGLPYDMRYLEWETLADPASDLAALNPLREIPTLKLPDGTIMTESAAICLWVTEQAPDAKLAPAIGSSDRPQFLRWLVWLVANIYPTFSYGDHPERLLADSAAAAALRQATDDRRQTLWRQLETTLPQGDWVLGDQMSALDIFVSVMTRWRPRRDWFETECPKLAAIARHVDALPALAPVWQHNFNGQD